MRRGAKARNGKRMTVSENGEMNENGTTRAST